MKWYGWLGLLLLLVSEYCMFRRIEPFYSWFYCFAWWSYILLADNLLLRLRGRSLLTGRSGELRTMLPLSVFIWLLFEAYNLALHNWAYEGVPAAIWARWSGYGFAFATVIPGLFITADLIEHLFFGAGARVAASDHELLASTPPADPRRMFLLLGILLSAAPVIWPRFFFATVWLGPIFLLDPLLEKLGVRSLSLQLAAGDRRRTWSLLAGGLACGLLWEFWNFWAASRWVYSIPYFGNWKMFEMPILGFLGFPPFALECWILYHLLRRLQQRCNTLPAQVAFWAGIGIFYIIMFGAIDTYTVLNFISGFPWSDPLWRFV